MWAHRNNWVVVNVPNPQLFLHDDQPDFQRHHKVGLYIQEKVTVQWLEFFKQSNEKLLREIDCNLKIYGKYGFSGQHDDDPEAVPNIYYNNRKAYFRDSLQHERDEEKKQHREQDALMETRISDKLKSPKKLIDIVDYGIQNKWFSINALYELLEQLYNLESHCVLIVVDKINLFYQRSSFPSFWYQMEKAHRGFVPPYHISLCRAFMFFDGHKIKNGFKLFATSVKQFHRHKFTPEQIHLSQGYSYRMNGIPLDDFRLMCQYYLDTQLWLCDDKVQNSQEFLWMITQGNWEDAENFMMSHYLDAIIFKQVDI